MGEWVSGSDGTGGADVPPAGERSVPRSGGAVNFGIYEPAFLDVADAGPRINGSHKLNGERRTEPADRSSPDGLRPRPLSVHEVNERIYQSTGLSAGLPDHLEPHRANSASTNAGAVFADRPTLQAAESGQRNIVSDAHTLRVEPGTYVFQSSGPADLPPGDVGLLILADPYYHDGTDIKLTFPAGAEFRESVARMTQARVSAPPEGFLARADADGNLVIAASDRYGYGGAPYPSGNAAAWIATAPPEPGY